MPSLRQLSVAMLCCFAWVSLWNTVTGNLPRSTSEPLYPYTLSYRLGEFQGAVFYGAPPGTAVAVKGTLGHEKYHPLYVGVDVTRTGDRNDLNPFSPNNNPHQSHGGRHNRSGEVDKNMVIRVLGTDAFFVDADGYILVQRGYEEYGLRSVIYFTVVLIERDHGTFRSNPLSFLVEVLENPDEAQKNKNAITAGILALLILFIAGLTAIAIKCRNCRAEENTHDQKSTSSEEDTMDWKDHYHIKAEDAIIMGNQNEACTRDGMKGNARLVRSDSNLSWLKLHPADEDDRDSGISSLPTISENCDDIRIEMMQDFNDFSLKTVPSAADPSKSILKKTKRNRKYPCGKPQNCSIKIPTDVKNITSSINNHITPKCI